MIFPPAFLDSSSWNNDNQHQHQHQHHQQQQAHHQQHQQVGAVAGGGGDATNNHELLQPSIMAGGGGPLPDGVVGNNVVNGQVVVGGPAKPMSMAERARLARVPLPEPGLKCPRCDSANTKFCYFNNYSLSQPRHFCRACRRYWTRGGALRNVPVGGGYRRHAKRAKPKQQQQAPSASSAGTTATANGGGGLQQGSTAAATATTTNAALHHHHGGMMGGGGGLSMLPPLLRLADFDAMSLGSSFSGIPSMGNNKPGFNIDAYSGGGGGAPAGLEHQWRVHQQQMQSFPFLHAMDQGPPSLAMAMAAPGMFQLGLDTTTTTGADNNGRGGAAAGGGEDGPSAGDLHMNVMQAAAATKRESYPAAPRGMYGDHYHQLAAAGGGGGYTSYSTNAATGNHLL